VVERLLGKLNAVIATRYGSTGRSVADRDGYPSRERACLTFAELETRKRHFERLCVLLLIMIDDGQRQPNCRASMMIRTGCCWVFFPSDGGF
jgi:hypothetical protein